MTLDGLGDFLPQGQTSVQLKGRAAAPDACNVVKWRSAFGGNTSKLSRTQKGRWLALCWIAQIYKHIPDPKPGYVADWVQLPEWQQETDADIFEVIERSMAGATR
ncbi:hypothetical protein [Nocardia asiatica]|uniref:hypothetical protein n=1 Tax=Nocardia asiatica TaxID=209252 RepID=UPI003EE1D8FA